MDIRADRDERVREIDQEESKMGTIKQILKSPEDSRLLAALLERDGRKDDLGQRLLEGKLDYDTDLDDLNDYRQEMTKVREATAEVKKNINPSILKEMAALSSVGGDASTLKKLTGSLGYDEVAEVVKSQIELLYVSDEAHFEDIKAGLEALKSREAAGDYIVKDIKGVCDKYGVDRGLVQQAAKLSDEGQRKKALRILANPEADNNALRQALQIDDDARRQQAFAELDDPFASGLPDSGLFGKIRFLKRKEEKRRYEKVDAAVNDLEASRTDFNNAKDRIDESLTSLGTILGASVDNDDMRGVFDIAFGSDRHKEALHERTVSGKDVAKMMPTPEEIDAEWDDFKSEKDFANKNAPDQQALRQEFRDKQKEKIKPKGKKGIGFFGEIAQAIAEARANAARLV